MCDSSPCVPPVGQDHSDLVADLLKELSNHNERSEERKAALVELLKITREDNMAEILRNQPARFKNYAELTIMKTLEAHKDSHKEVGRPPMQPGPFRAR
ncbi:unnamed protein product [Menidia menidia]|uniref:(Atlantic silverside) hypothetical protein n=1 Tax=Menidia menidia TaxID=238744 RepID=A0A8S4AGA4_9TELE|nr:unnamed protein product [Menidia menidia]